MAEVFYGSLVAALAYHAAHGGQAWSASGVSDGDREAALLRASEALDGTYGARFPGVKAGGDAQVREWPREGASNHCTGLKIADDVVPAGIERATYVMALAEVIHPGILAPSFTLAKINKVERVEGAVMRERFGPKDGVALTLANAIPRFAAVEAELRCLLTPKAGASVDLLRV